MIVQRRRTRLIASVATVTVTALVLGGAASAAPSGGGDDGPQSPAGDTKLPEPNPYLALVPDPSTINWAYWKEQAASESRRIARQAPRAPEPPAPFAYDEQEPEGTTGSNDTDATAERIAGFGTGNNKRQAVRILGDLFVPEIPTDDLATAEDQGSIPLATNTGISNRRDGVTVESEIGDGPHGSDGTDNGDFDFFRLNVDAGDTIRANTAGSDFDTMLAVYDSAGEIVAFNDDTEDLTSEVRYRVEDSGTYYVLVTGFFVLPDDPLDSSSGSGAGAEGEYTAEITAGLADVDYYEVYLRSGDTVGGVIDEGSPDLTVTKPNGVESVGSTQDASFIYPASTRLPGGGNAVFAYVAERTGWYSVSTETGAGDYDILLEAYRPRSETKPAGTKQTVFLDYDGERLNTGIFGGAGVRTLSPLSSFVARWGLTNADLVALQAQITRTVRENVRDDLAAQGLNPNLGVRIRTSQLDEDEFGQRNISRVVVGGTIEQSGIPTIGIAQSIDPGNFEGAETALVLLDVLSGTVAEWGDASLNFYLRPRSDRVRFVGTAIGNVVSHEIGHYIGSFHVDQFNQRLNLMDQGGNFPLLYGVGPDGVGGTADDPDVDFGEDVYNPNEGFTGIEDTLNNSAWGLVLGAG